MTLSTKTDVWFIDNDIAYRFLVRLELEDHKCCGRVRMFDDGDVTVMELIKICSSNRSNLPKVIFADLNSKRLGGWHLVETLKELEIDTNVVLYSAKPTPADDLRAQKEPIVKKLLVKESNPAGMLNIMSQFVGSSPM